MQHIWDQANMLTEEDDEAGQPLLAELKGDIDGLAGDQQDQKPEDYDPDVVSGDG